MDHNSSVNHARISWHPGKYSMSRHRSAIQNQTALSKGKFKRSRTLFKKCQRSGQDVQLALLQLRATPVYNNLPSPAEMLMNRKLATTLPSRTEPAPEPQREKLAERCEKMTRNCNRRAGTQLSPLHQG